jgi:cytochrome c oxidase subunit 2
MQSLALTIFLVFAAITVAIFTFVAASTRTPDELSQKGYKRVRLLVLVGLTSLAVVMLILTLPITPYPDNGVAPDRVIYVSGKQFAFKLSDKPISREDAMDDEVFLTIKPIRTGDLVEFRVTGADVTHGFSIYDLGGTVQTQTQAMPQYVNRLRHRFPKSGTYHVLCFEFCGIGHPTMRAQLQVEDDPKDVPAAAETPVASN